MLLIPWLLLRLCGRGSFLNSTPALAHLTTGEGGTEWMRVVMDLVLSLGAAAGVQKGSLYLPEA